MLNQNRGDPLGFNDAQGLCDLVDDHGGEALIGFIEQQHFDVTRQRPGDREHLLLTTRERHTLLFAPLQHTQQKIVVNQNLLKKTFKAALNELLENRKTEGEKINKTFISKISKIQNNLAKISKSNPKLTKLRAETLNKKVKMLCDNLDKDRLEQEVAMLVLKHDVAEEIERIDFHLSSLMKELSIKNGSGKKIDFILQELFRETSTLSVKIDHPGYKQIALDMKLSVEEMREQAQNIE